jgi:hypothetical protein
MFDRIKKIAAAVVMSVATAVPAFAEPVLDFTGVGTAVTNELSPAIAAAMPIAGIILAAGIGWKLYKRFTK